MNRDLVKYPLYLILHPFDGYWELKYERNQKQSLIFAIAILFMLALTNILSSQYSGFVVHIVDPKSMNSFMEIIYVLVPVLFFCIANWSLTTLLDGEGKFVEIFTSTCFALIPLVLINFPWIWLSNVISMEESVFYYFSSSLALIWFVFMLFIGNMTIHQFSPSKSILTILLTIVAMGFMAFLSLLFFSLIQQIISFISVIYQELALRN
ncbi:MAG TPA: YIP1 family protein [Candidatus Paenibacillus intestinavium]|nr:YIP1 family protein [Candidatus Paenibacillus intestinavium]